jgi:uncharacterized damage-inducible protein DinB
MLWLGWRAKGESVKILLLAMLLRAASLDAQTEGVFQGYNGEWSHVSKQLTALAEAIPADKFAWRPAAGVRSVSEVYMHIATANFGLLRATGVTMPADFKPREMEKIVTAKADVIDWLRRSLNAVKTARAGLKPDDLQRKGKGFRGRCQHRWRLSSDYCAC